MNRWYVAQTHPKAEAKALRHLRRQGFGIYFPHYLKRRRHARRTENVPAPLFPGYLFVSIDLARSRWRCIRSTFGVRRLVCNGDQPAPVPEGVVEHIRRREDEVGMIALKEPAPFSRGDVVRVTQGPLSEQVGLFECATDDERVVVLLGLLGRSVRIQLPLDAVRAFA